MEDVRLPAALKSIGPMTFRDCKNLRRIALPDKIKCIGKGCFYSSGLEEIELPRSLEKIRPGTFDECRSLKTIRVNDGCNAGLCAARAPNTTKIVPLLTTVVGTVNILDLRNIAQVVIPEGTERIGNHWFCCSDVVSVTIPASVAEIGTSAFCECKKLATVVFQRYTEPERARGGSIFSCCMGKTDDEEAPFVDSKLRLIGREAFCGCSSLRNIDLPDSVEEIGVDAFLSSGLETFVAPKALRTLRQSALENCKNLKHV